MSDSGVPGFDASLLADSGAINSGRIILGAMAVSGATTFPVDTIVAGFSSDFTYVPTYTLTYNADGGLGPCQVEISTGIVVPNGIDVSAGEISISGGSRPFQLMPMVDMGDAATVVHYGSLDPATTGGTVAAGATLTFTASGGTVPAFSTQVVVPGAIAITTPDVAHAATLTISRTTDLSVAWTGGTTGDLVFTISQGSGAKTAGGVEIICTFPESAGRGTVPAAALSFLSGTSQLEAGPYSGTGIVIALLSSSTPAVSGWQMEIDVRVLPQIATKTVTVE